MENVILISGLSLNLVSTVVGMVILAGKLEARGKWQGWAETKIKSNCARITAHGKKIDRNAEAIALHKGESSG